MYLFINLLYLIHDCNINQTRTPTAQAKGERLKHAEHRFFQCVCKPVITVVSYRHHGGLHRETYVAGVW